MNLVGWMDGWMEIMTGFSRNDVVRY